MITADTITGPRGELGSGTPGSRIKSIRRESGQSLRAFARKHASLDGSPFATDSGMWLRNKAAARRRYRKAALS